MTSHSGTHRDGRKGSSQYEPPQDVGRPTPREFRTPRPGIGEGMPTPLIRPGHVINHERHFGRCLVRSVSAVFDVQHPHEFDATVIF
jgi:hypothetical protein